MKVTVFSFMSVFTTVHLILWDKIASYLSLNSIIIILKSAAINIVHNFKNCGFSFIVIFPLYI